MHKIYKITTWKSVAMASMLALTLTSCTQNAFTGERQASRTAIGAGAGAAVGGAIGAFAFGKKHRARNALIGAGIGALAGGSVGYYMDRQNAALRERLQGTGVSVTRAGDNIILNMPGNITFDTNQTAIKSNFYEVLNSVAIVLNEYDQTYVDVIGHTDSVGSASYNQSLSEQRASSVASYLQSQGVFGQRFSVFGMGETRPIGNNATEQGRALNRRVEIQIVPFT